MNKIENIKLKEFSTSPKAERLDSILKSILPVNNFAGNKIDLDFLPYNDFRECEALLKKGKTFEDICKAFCLAYSISESDFWNCGVIDFYQAKNYLLDTILKVRRMESQLLKSIDKDANLWQMAGGDELNVFGSIMPLVKLGKIYGMFPYDVGLKPYAKVLTLLVLHKKEDEITRKYRDLKTPKK